MVHELIVLGFAEVWVQWEELLVAAFEDIHLSVVQAGVVVGYLFLFPDELA
jgi:hypothetical protein